MTAKDVMTRDVVTVLPSMDLHALAKLFIEKNIGGAPVLDDEFKLLGVVLEEGLVFQDKKVHLPTFINIAFGFISLGVDRLEEEVRKISAITVAEIMDKDPHVISEETSVEDICTLMVDKNIHYFPVVHNGVLVGVVTKKDIVRAIAEGKL